MTIPNQLIETVKVSPLVTLGLGWLADVPWQTATLVLGAIYALLLVIHKVYQMSKEFLSDRAARKLAAQVAVFVDKPVPAAPVPTTITITKGD